MKFISLLGIVAIIGVAWLLSEHKRRFPFRAVLWGLVLQFFFGWFKHKLFIPLYEIKKEETYWPLPFFE
jgi:nucleoside permease NupC